MAHPDVERKIRPFPDRRRNLAGKQGLSNMLQNSGIYIFYILAVLAIGLLCVVTIWLGTRSKNGKAKRQYAARRNQRAEAASGAFKTTRNFRSRRKSSATGSDSRLRGRDEQNIPAIWGW
jgi:hypothetical protein